MKLDMKRVLPLLLIVCMLLCACTQKAPDQTTKAPETTTVPPAVTTIPPAETTEQTTIPEETDVTVEETTAPQEQIVAFRHPLNGMPLEEPCTLRPFAITINNQSGALPVCSLSSADMMVEILAEGGITRFLGIYSDISELDHIGSIRSTRPYLVDLAESFDAIYVHHGGSRDGYNEIYNLGMDYMDAIKNAGGYYYRDQYRLDAGYDLEHTSFADGADLIDGAADLGYSLVREDGIDYGYQFAEFGSTLDGESAMQMEVVFGDYGKTTTISYQEDSGVYVLGEYGDTIVDGNNDKALAFRNVIYLTAETYEYVDRDNVIRMHITLTGEGDGYFACDGKVVPIRWSRSGDEEPFVFTHDDGTPITLGVGNTYVAVTPWDGALEY